MNEMLSKDIKEITQVVHYQPSVSILMPLEPKIGLKAELEKRLKFTSDKLERDLLQKYSPELVVAVLNKLKRITENLEVDTKKKSIAIFISPVFEKVVFLDIPIEEKVVIDESFEVRDLVYAGKGLHRYLVMILSGTWIKTYLGNSSSFIHLKSGVPDNMNAFDYDVAERVANFSDPKDLKENHLKKFLQQADAGLKQFLMDYPLPVFVLGTKKDIGYFKQLTKNEKQIAGYIHGNYEEATVAELRELLKPQVEEWQKRKMESLFEGIEKAANAGKMAKGIVDVWKMASSHRGRLLVVEKNYMFAASFSINQDTIEPYTGQAEGMLHIRDAVDDVIEKVLKDGGEVEFVEEGMLSDFQKILLIQYY